MRTILALSLITAAFAFVPSAEASVACDPTYTVCAGSYYYGTCDNGYAQNFVQVFDYSPDTGYVNAAAYTYCAGGWIEATEIGAGATYCDTNWNCAYAGAYWYAYEIPGWFSGCGSYAYAWAPDYGIDVFQPLPLCDVAGAPPAVPALFP